MVCSIAYLLPQVEQKCLLQRKGTNLGTTVRVRIHNAEVGRVIKIDHLINNFHFTATWVQGIFNFFIKK